MVHSAVGGSSVGCHICLAGYGEEEAFLGMQRLRQAERIPLSVHSLHISLIQNLACRLSAPVQVYQHQSDVLSAAFASDGPPLQLVHDGLSLEYCSHNL